MTRRCMVVSIACVLSATSRLPAQETKSTPPARAPRSVDPAQAAMKREAEARQKAQDDIFAALRGLPAAPAPVPALVIRGNVMLRREVVVRRVARAQGDDEADDDEQPWPEVVIAEESFDEWLFGHIGNAVAARGRLDALLATTIGQADQASPMTPNQKVRLRLAGRGDIKRFFDQVEEKRDEFQLVRTDLNRCREFVRDLQPLRSTFQEGPFGRGSIYAKTLKRILNEQREAQRSSK